MATSNPTLVSSFPYHLIIPTTPPPMSVKAMSSSPTLPSPSKLFARKASSTVPNIYASPVLERTTTRFTSASDLLREAHAIEQTQGFLTEATKQRGERGFPENQENNTVQSRELKNRVNPENRKQKTANSRKLSSDSSVNIKQTKVPRKTPAKPAPKTVAFDGKPHIPQDSEMLKVLVPAKKRTKKSKDEGQTTIERSKITKPGAAISDSISKKSKPINSAKFPRIDYESAVKPSIKESDELIILDEESLDLCLVEAIKRRKSWTPTRDTKGHLSNLEDGTTPRALNSSNERKTRQSSLSGFENLFGDYGYTRNESPLYDIDKFRDMAGEALTKRRRLELVDINGYPPVPCFQSEKPKPPKKKAQTITEKATAPFVFEEPALRCVPQYVENPVTEANEETQTKNQPAVPNPKTVQRRPRAKNKINPPTSKAKKKADPPLLLSPETAMKSTEDQELIFGTSSQLARDESPIDTRSKRQSPQASELTDNQLTPKPTKETSMSSMPRFSGVGASAITPFASSKNLWSVATRNMDGALLNVEVVDLVDTPNPSKTAPAPGQRAIPVPDKSSGGLDPSIEWKLIDEISELNQLSNTSGKGTLIEQVDTPLEHSIPRSIAEASLRRRKSRSPVKKPKAPTESEIPNPPNALNQMPNYTGFTTVDLAKAVAAYGFKAIKKRTEMIALLERCWESQSRIALQVLPPPTNLPESQPSMINADMPKQASPSKKTSRSRKASISAAKGDENPATDPSLQLKKPRGRPKKTSPAAPEIPTPALSPTIPRLTNSRPINITKTAPAPAPSLHALITLAVTTFPPTHSATDPSFYERILLYEPIVLEDLTRWLNTVGLARVGVDDEVSGALVKEWCEGRGVCCFWREEGWRAKRG